MKSRVVDKSEIIVEMFKQVYGATTILFFFKRKFYYKHCLKGLKLVRVRICIK